MYTEFLSPAIFIKIQERLSLIDEFPQYTIWRFCRFQSYIVKLPNSVTAPLCSWYSAIRLTCKQKYLIAYIKTFNFQANLRSTATLYFLKKQNSKSLSGRKSHRIPQSLSLSM